MARMASGPSLLVACAMLVIIIASPSVSTQTLGGDVGSPTLTDADGCVTLAFETTLGGVPLANGEKLQGTLGRLVGVGSRGENLGATIFDTDPKGPNASGADPDLLVGLGNSLILQSEDDPVQANGVFTTPNDAAEGGSVFFRFRRPISPISIDLIDICPGDQDAELQLTDRSGLRRVYNVPAGWTTDLTKGGTGWATLDLQSLEDQVGSSTSASVVEQAGFSPSEVMHLAVNFTGSGALDNLVLCLSDPLAPIVEESYDVDLGSSLAFTVEFPPEAVLSAAPLPLAPNMNLDSMTGAFTFTPDPSQSGEQFALDFVASLDGDAASASTLITVVPPKAGQLTGLSGRLLDTNDFVIGVETPIAGAIISLLGGGPQAASGPNGYFSLKGTGAGMQILDIDASTATPAPDGSPYASFREELELLENVNNVISRPFFLPRIDVDSLTTVDPSMTTVVYNPNLDITMTVPPNTAKNSDGTNFTGDLSISLVPEALAPASLPEFLEPGLLITIQPVGVSYNTPVPISFPNLDALPPGTMANLWSLDPTQGTFDIFGQLEVSSDGTTLNTVSGGVAANDWHGPTPNQPDDDPSEQPEDDDQNPDECPGASGSSTGLHSGRLVVSHDLVPYRSMGEERSVRLTYNSTTADPQPLIKSVSSIPSNTAVPETLSAELTLGGIAQGELFTSTTNPSGGLSGAARLVCQIDAANIPTGQLPYLLAVSSNYPQTTVSRFRAGSLLINNERQSSIGCGWTVEGLQRIYLQAAGTRAILTDGTGSIKAFTPQQSLSGVATDIAFVLDGSGSVSGTEFAIQIDGLAAAIEDPLTVPPDGSTAFAVVQFSSSSVIEIPLTIIDSPQTAQSIAAQVRGIDRLGGGTAIHAGLDTATAALASGSPDARQVICLSTDGGSNVQLALTAAQSAVSAGVEEIDTIGIGNGINADLLMQIATIGSGFFVTAPTFQDFANSVDEKLQAVIGGNPPGDFSFVVRNDDDTYTREMKDGTRHDFSPAGLHITTSRPTGETTTYQYDQDGHISAIIDPAGLTTTFIYNNEMLASITDPADRETRFLHDANGCLTQIIEPDGTVRFFEYDDRGRMTRQVSKRGFATDYEYDFAGRHCRSILPDGTTRQIRARDPIGLIDTSNGAGTAASPSPFIAAEDALGVFEDGDGFETYVSTNSFGSLLNHIDGNGSQTTAERSTDNLIVQVTHPNGRIDEAQYDDSGNLTLLREAVGSSTEREFRWTYNQRSQVTLYEDAEGNVTVNSYDESGNLLEVTDPNGNTRTRNYIPGTSLVESIINENGNTTSFLYDSRYRLASIVTPDGTATNYTRDAAGNILLITEAAGTPSERTRTFTYDSHNRVLTAATGLGETTTFSYDASGNLLTTTNPSGESIGRGYDELDRLVVLSDPQSGVTMLQYDGRGNITTKTDALGNSSTSEYDGVGQLTRRVNALGAIEIYQYDPTGNLVAYTDSNGNTYAYSYDMFSRMTLNCNPLNHCSSFEYDRIDNVIQRTTPNGATVTFMHDALSRLIRGSYPDNTIQYEYDSVGNLLTVVDDDTAIQYCYDSNNRLITAITSPDALQPFVTAPVQPQITLSYSYDALGNRTSVLDSLGGMTLYGYDESGRLTSILTPASELVQQSFDAAGRLARIDYPNGVTGTFDYEPSTGRLERMLYAGPTGILTDRAYLYDAVGNIVQIGGSDQRTFVYDAAYQVVAAGNSNGAEFYQYDLAGNVVSSHLSAAYLYDASNRLLQIDTASFGYDNNGNLTSRNTDTGVSVSYHWDSENRLTSVEQGGLAVVDFKHDGLGRRVADTSEDSSFVYDRNNQYLAFAGGSLHRRSIYSERADDLRAVYEGGASLYAHLDHLQSVILLTDSQGIPGASTQYSAFGVPSSAASDNQSTYAGRPIVSSIALYDFRARWYDPALGRFISRDPLGQRIPGFENDYRYVRNNPVNHRDPSGLYGTNECGYYDQRCDEVGGEYYCEVAPSWCDWFPKSPDPLPHESNDFEGWTRCVRECLQDCDSEATKDRPRRCIEAEGPDPNTDGFWDWIPFSCHVKCYSWCAAWGVSDIIVPPAY